MIAPHATPAAAYAALGEFLTEDAPELMGADVAISYDYGDNHRGPTVISFAARIHVPESAFAAWLELHGFAAGDVVRGKWTETNDVRRVTSHTGVEIFCLTPKAAGGGAE